MSNNRLLVCGHRALDRVKSLISSNNLDIEIKEAENKEDILKELEKNIPSICIIEHEFGFLEMTKQYRNRLFAKFFEDIFKSSEMSPESVEQFRACDLLPKMIRVSPETKYVVTSHIRGSGVTKEEKEIYRQIPEVIKVMGFINSQTNIDYLLKLFNKTYSL